MEVRGWRLGLVLPLPGAHQHAPPHVALRQVPRLCVGHVLVSDEERLVKG